MKRTLLVVVGLLLCTLGASELDAAEHNFGLRVGTFQFDKDAPLLTDSILIRRPQFKELTYTRDFDASGFDGNLYEIYYEWRRDTDAHFSLAITGGWYGQDQSETVPGVVIVEDARVDGQVTIPATVQNDLNFTMYYANVEGRYNFTTRKVRFFLGMGAGLWANIWNEVVNAEYPDIFDNCAPGTDPILCPETTTFRESDGNRRTVVPLSGAAGLVWQFLPHWSVNVEARYLFNGGTNVTLFRLSSDYDITGPQYLLGFSYRL